MSSAYLESGKNSMVANLGTQHPNSVSGYVRIKSRESVVFGGKSSSGTISGPQTITNQLTVTSPGHNETGNTVNTSIVSDTNTNSAAPAKPNTTVNTYRLKQAALGAARMNQVKSSKAGHSSQRVSQHYDSLVSASGQHRSAAEIFNEKQVTIGDQYGSLQYQSQLVHDSSNQ